MKKFIGILAVSFLFVSCDIWSQIEQTAALQNCKFSLKNVQDVAIAGVKIKNLKNLSASDIVKLTAAIASKKIPLDLNVNVGIQNPSQQKAAINGLDWICAIDGYEVFLPGSQLYKNIEDYEAYVGRSVEVMVQRADKWSTVVSHKDYRRKLYERKEVLINLKRAFL